MQFYTKNGKKIKNYSFIIDFWRCNNNCFI